MLSLPSALAHQLALAATAGGKTEGSDIEGGSQSEGVVGRQFVALSPLVSP